LLPLLLVAAGLLAICIVRGTSRESFLFLISIFVDRRRRRRALFFDVVYNKFSVCLTTTTTTTTL